MTKRPDTGAASVSPCPTCACRSSETLIITDGGKPVRRPERTGGSKQNGASPVDNAPITVTVANAGTMSGLSVATLYRLIERGELDTIKIGRRRLVRVDSIKRLVGAA